MTHPPRGSFCLCMQLRLVGVLLTSLVLGACGAPRAPLAPVESAEAVYLRSRELVVPVKGVEPDALRDSFNAARSGGRVHQAVDIMAKKGTPVLAADDGFVLRVSRNDLGGKVIYLSDPKRRLVYYYAHLDTQRRGLREGDRVRRGDRIGTVGYTGNATKDAPHLHFQVFRMGPPERWWEGAVLDPLPNLLRAGSN